MSIRIQKWVRIFLVIIFFSLLTQSVKAQTEPEVILVSQLDYSDFPNISLTARVFDNTGMRMSDVSEKQLNVFEDQEKVNITIRPGESLANHVYFVVDRGQYSTFEDFKTNELNNIFESYLQESNFRENFDSVGLLVTDSSLADFQIISPLTQSADDFRNSLTPSVFTKVGRSASLEGIRRAFNDLSKYAPEGNLAVVYIGPGFDGDVTSILEKKATSLAEDFVKMGATFYAVYTPGYVKEPSEALVKGSGGRVVNYMVGRDNSAEIDSIYDDIKSQSSTMQIAYRSKSKVNTKRVISVFPENTPKEDANATLSYQIELVAPEIKITSPLSIVRTGELKQDGAPAFETASAPIVVKFDWPDNISRDITTLEFSVNEQIIDSLDPTGTTHSFSLDISNQTENATFISLPIMLRIRDELGFQEILKQTITVEVNITNTAAIASTQTAEAIQAADAIATKTSQEAEVADAIAAVEGATEKATLWTVVAILALGTLLVVTVLAFYYWTKLQEYGVQIGSAVSAAVTSLTTFIVGDRDRGKDVIAELLVLDGRAVDVGNRIEIFDNTTSFGRDLSVSTHQIHGPKEQIVSRKHFTIRYETSTQQFYIIDEGSKNHTYLNRKRLAPMDPSRLRDQQQISVGNHYQGGIRFQFFSKTNATILDSHVEHADDEPTVVRQREETPDTSLEDPEQNDAASRAHREDMKRLMGRR
ncbi:MAG: FHA domain-containing protein [Candidatus Promineifilaceae bacterium]